MIATSIAILIKNTGMVILVDNAARLGIKLMAIAAITGIHNKLPAPACRESSIAMGVSIQP